MIELLKQIAKFMVVYRKFWLGPVIVGLLLLGSLLVLAEGSVLAPFIYAIF